LQHAYDCSDEEIVNTWMENPYVQYFTGETYFQTEAPMDSSSLTRWRKRIGEDGGFRLGHQATGVPTGNALSHVVARLSGPIININKLRRQLSNSRSPVTRNTPVRAFGVA